MLTRYNILSLDTIVVIPPQSAWQSCNIIQRNLVASYKLAFPNALYIYPEQFKEQKNIKRVFWVPHFPHPLQSGEFREFYLSHKDIEYFWHVYGDFTYLIEFWQELALISSQSKNLFICASSRHEKLLKDYLGSSAPTKVIPFPVDLDELNQPSQTRIEIRKSLKLEDENHLIIYHGRISLQKNVIQVIKNFNKLPKHTHLLILGWFDEIALPVQNISMPMGWFRAKFEQFFSLLPPSLKKRVHIIPSPERSKVMAYLKASDSAIVAGTYHDEDYGMSVAEAISCGLKVFASNWGGFADFTKYGDITLLDLNKENEFPEVDFTKWINYNFGLSPLLPCDQLGIQKISHSLKELKAKEAWSPFFKKFKKNKQGFLVLGQNEYFNTYKAYLPDGHDPSYFALPKDWIEWSLRKPHLNQSQFPKAPDINPYFRKIDPHFYSYFLSIPNSFSHVFLAEEFNSIQLNSHTVLLQDGRTGLDRVKLIAQTYKTSSFLIHKDIYHHDLPSNIKPFNYHSQKRSNTRLLLAPFTTDTTLPNFDDHYSQVEIFWKPNLEINGQKFNSPVLMEQLIQKFGNRMRLCQLWDFELMSSAENAEFYLWHDGKYFSVSYFYLLWLSRGATISNYDDDGQLTRLIDLGGGIKIKTTP
ncbi:MAG: hypothetical protein COW01_02895 [Bdellovibrionales bacterium CG12_big_fil_rev_8_21_14_0_65_38_15]|nr:MAG: hypothetical protein COW79_08560 [Bdellovibrionales bacterium CG22_combo_CG10-13_8_21_14_all_38_13]PIQ57037.1 MAG: hypothetical protein COW01_02895 [Bdellovibrionales bacterium CG12_big_fil_rev_8_21_14_0_65_38_15]PIR29001.1 MAG: hypothetical protein COV38_12225 [Bdellovibrionales bacterium CG11_big_fil_rev_8_21_14_0_20_38_13]